jgi:Ca2+-binding RTX toxin-like protein
MQLPTDRHAGKNVVGSTELLESRRLLAYSAVVSSSGLLTINGSGGADNIVLAKPHTVITVTEGSSTSGFRSDKVKKILVNLGGGNDKFTASSFSYLGITINGGSGKDTVTGGGGADIISGGGDNDSIHGGNGNDKIYGNDGSDRIYDDADKDSCYGGSGNDSIFADPFYASADYYDGGDGTDLIAYDARHAGVMITNDGVANDGKRYGSGYSSLEHDNVLPNIEKVEGSYYDDKIKLTGNINNYIYGLSGNDSIDAGAGNDTITSSFGDDTVYGGSGNDYIAGGWDNDAIYGDSGKDTIYGELGHDLIGGGSDDDSISGGSDNDIVHGDSGNDKLSGDSGNDYIEGDAGNDFLSGGDGNDNLHGGDGNDILTGDTGYDRMYGEADNDRLYSLDAVYSEIVDGGGGSDFAVIDKLPIFPYSLPGDTIGNVESWQ